MVEIPNIDFLYPEWLTSRLHAVSERWESFKNYQVMRRVNQAKEFVSQAKQFIYNHPVISMFLAVVAMLSFIPVFIFLSVISGSFVVIFVTALTVFNGVVVVCLLPLLTVLVPVLMIGGTAAVFAYLAYATVAKILRIVKLIFSKFASKLTVKNVLPSCFNGPFRFHSDVIKIEPREGLSDEEPFEEELFNSSPKRF